MPHRGELKDTDAEIMRLVQDANDPQHKATLLVLLRISHNLNQNTDLTKTLHTDFEKHRTDVVAYMENGNALLNKGIGAWKIVAWIGSGLQAVILVVATYYMGQIRDHESRIAKLEWKLEDTAETLRDHLRQANPLMRQLQQERGIDPKAPERK